MFQTQTFLSITAGMINRMRLTGAGLITDFNIGSNCRTMLEAVSQQVDEVYQQIVNAIQEGIPVATYLSFGFETQAATYATLPLTVTITAQSAAVTIAAGTIFTPATGGSVTYSSAAAVTIPAGATAATVQVQASVAGSSGNIASGVSMTPSNGPAGFVSAVTASEATNGTDTETDEQKKTRFQEYIISLARSPVAAVEYGASTARITDASGNIVEKAKFIYVYEPYLADNTQPTGLMYIYIHNGSGNTSDALVTLTQTIIDGVRNEDGTTVVGYKAAGVVAVVKKASDVLQAVSGSVVAKAGYVQADLDAAVTSAITTYIEGLSIGASIEIAAIYQAAMNVTGVQNYIAVAPLADVAIDVSAKAIPGVIQIS